MDSKCDNCDNRVPSGQFCCEECYNRLPVMVKWQIKDWDTKKGPTLKQAHRFMLAARECWATERGRKDDIQPVENQTP